MCASLLGTAQGCLVGSATGHDLFQKTCCCHAFKDSSQLPSVQEQFNRFSIRGYRILGIYTDMMHTTHSEKAFFSVIWIKSHNRANKSLNSHLSAQKFSRHIFGIRKFNQKLKFDSFEKEGIINIIYDSISSIERLFGSLDLL